MTLRDASRETAILLWACVGLFALRVFGQLEVLLLEPPWLPQLEAWYSGLLPYPLLLPLQIAILMFMAVVAWNPRVRRGRFAHAHPRAAQLLRLFALLYFVVMARRERQRAPRGFLERGRHTRGLPLGAGAVHASKRSGANP